MEFLNNYKSALDKRLHVVFGVIAIAVIVEIALIGSMYA